MTNLDSSSMQYSRPPIIESIINIQFEKDVGFKEVEALRKKFSKHYFNEIEIPHYNVKVEVRENTKKHEAKVKQESISYRFSNEDSNQLLVLEPNSFIVSQLAPYAGWDEFYERFRRDWEAWRRVVGYQKISRIGVRYINRLDIPLKNEKVKHEEYVNIYPRLPSYFSSVNSYQVECIIPLDEVNAELRLNSAVVPSPVLNHLSVLIDQDIFKDNELPQKNADLFMYLEAIHKEKNKVFELCVSDKARELFK